MALLLLSFAALALLALVAAWPDLSPWLAARLDDCLLGDEPDFDDDDRGGL